MVMVRRISNPVEARQMPLYPTAEQCSEICDWIAQDLGYSEGQVNGMGVGKDPVTGLVMINNPMGKVLVGLGHWVIRIDPQNYLVLHGDHFDIDYKVVEEEPEPVPVEDDVTVGLEPEKETI